MKISSVEKLIFPLKSLIFFEQSLLVGLLWGFYFLTCFIPHLFFFLFLMESKRKEENGHLKVPSISKPFCDLMK